MITFAQQHTGMTDFVRRLVHHVIHPGPLPIRLGSPRVMDGRPAKHFAESRSGTFLSASLLLVSAGLCGTRSRAIRLDDDMVLLYGLMAAAWAFRYRNSLLRLRWARALMALAGVGFVCTVAADPVRGWPATEERFKIISEALIVVALLAARTESRAWRAGLCTEFVPRTNARREAAEVSSAP